MRVWRNGLNLDKEFVITSGAWRLSHFNTLTALYNPETKQIKKNARWSGTYVEFGVGYTELVWFFDFFKAFFSPMTWFLASIDVIHSPAVFFGKLRVIHKSDLNERSHLPEVRRTSLETTGHSSST